MTLLKAEGLSKHYEVGGGLFSSPSVVRALNDVSFELRAGQTLAVVGESGCGKSTLARQVTLIEHPSAGQFTLGTHVVSAGTEHKPDAALRQMVQIVFQDPYGSLNPRQKIGKLLQEPLLINRPSMSAAEREARARDMLKRVGLRPEHHDRYPHMFSGGQRQRIAVARALMLDPEIIVLDEPVSALDLSIQSQVLNLLVDLQEERNLAYLFISHDLSVVRHMADEVMVMYLGNVVEQGPAESVFESPQHPYTQALLSATPIADPAHSRTRIRLEGELPSPLNPPAGCPFHPRCWKVQERCHQQRPQLEMKNEDQRHRIACYFPG